MKNETHKPDQEWTLLYASNNVVGPQVCLLALKVKLANYIEKKLYGIYVWATKQRELKKSIDLYKTKVLQFLEVDP